MVMAKYSSKIRLPILRYSVNISYSEVKKPSGIAYIILMMVDSAGLTKFSWADQMAEFELPTVMFGVFKDEMEIMKENGMLDFKDVITLKTPVNQVTMTENGKKIFEQGIISTNTKSRLETILQFPADGKESFRIQTAKNQGSIIEGIESRYESIEYDENTVNEFIAENKHRFHIKTSDSIFGIDYLSKSKCSYLTEVDTSFNEFLGCFTIQGNKKINEGFIKKYLSSEEIIEKMITDPFKLPSKLSAYKARNAVEWQDYSCVLPAALDLSKEKYVIYPSNNPPIEGGYVVNALLDDGDFAIINSKSMGSLYQYVTKDVHISGMNGSVSKQLFIRKALDSTSIQNIILDIAETQYSDDLIGLDSAITILNRIEYTGGIEYFLKKYLVATMDAQGIVELSKKYKKSAWVRNIRKLLIDVMYEMPHVNRLSLCKSISSAHISINGQQAGYSLYSANNRENLELADFLLKISTVISRDELLANLHIADIVAEYIQDGLKLNDPVSDLFKSMNYASISLEKLKEYTGADDLSDYFYSYEKILPENKDKIKKYAQDLTFNLESLNEKVPSDALDNLIDIAKVYADIALSIDDTQEIDYRKANGRLFGINMRIRIEDDLKRLLNDSVSDLSTLIMNASNIYINKQSRTKLILDSQKKVLNDIRHFGNSCAHQKVIPSHDQDELNKWVDVVEEVELAIDNYLSNKVC